jgi:hypothetical protein
VGVILAIVLMMSSLCYIDEYGRQFSIYDLMRYFPREKLTERTSFSAYMIFSGGLGSFITMFIPMVAAFPLVPVFCNERSGGFIRFPLVRVGRIRYLFSKVIAAIISGGFVVTLAFLIFGIIVFIYFPALNDFPASGTRYIFENMIPNGMGIGIFIKCIQIFCYGALYSLPALAVSAITSNKYIALCVPFMFKYLYDTIIQKIAIQAMTDINMNVLEISNMLNSNSIILSGESLFSIVLCLLFAVMLIVFFVLLMNKKLKCGE